MRILHAIHSFPPESRGGVETYLQLLARQQLADGDLPAVLAGTDQPRGRNGAQPQESFAGVPVQRLVMTRDPAHWFSGTAGEAAVLHPVLQAQAPDLLHVHHWHNLSPDLIGIARDLGIPVVVTLHDFFATCPLFFRLADGATPCVPDLPVATCASCLSRFVATTASALEPLVTARQDRFARELARAQAVLALSPPQQEFLQRMPWLGSVRIRTLLMPQPPVPVPRSPWTPLTDGRLRLVTWGGLVPGKGLRTVVQAAESLDAAERIGIDHFGRVLDEPHAADLRQLARRCRLRLCGPYDETTMAESFAGYDAMVFPSLYLETHGFVVDEAMALGLPVIVTDRGAPHLRTGARGRMVPAGDVNALAAVLDELRQQPETLAAMRAAVPPPQPSLQQHTGELADCYRAALAEG